MNAFNAALQRLGGPGAVTWWAFWISLADRLLTVSVQPINMGAPLSARITATVLAQFAMFAPLVLLRFTLLKDPLHPRPWVALAGFAVADVIRALVVDRLLHELGGLPLMPELRVFSGFVPTIIPLLVTAYVVNTLQERRRELAALLEVRDELQRSREEAEDSVQVRNEELVQRVRTVMESELAALASEQPAGVVAQLQRTASEVVRPLSHELATSFAERESVMPARDSVQVGWRQVLWDTSFEKPLAPGLTTVLLSGVWLSAAVTFVPVRWAFVVSLAVMPLVLAGGNLILRQLLPGLRLLGRIALVAGACLVAGIAMGLIVRLLCGTWSSAVSISYAGGFYVAVVSGGLAVVNGLLGARTALLAELAESTQALRRQVVRTQQLRWFHQRALSRALHGPVQSVVTAAAIRLDDAARQDTINASVIDGVRTEVLDVLDVLAAPNAVIASMREGIARIHGTWEGVCAIDVTLSPRARDLDSDAVLRACALDVLTDAVSNAVRHGGATVIDVVISAHEDVLHVMVSDNGNVAPVSNSKSGLGTSLLEECTLEWSLRTKDDGGHELVARFPMVAADEMTAATLNA